MDRGASPTVLRVQQLVQCAAMGLLGLIALGLVAAAGLAAAGIWPWIELPVSFGGAEVVGAGMFAQIALTALVVLLVFFLPSSLRVLRLETSHRNFQVRMEDVANAYWAVHRADRTGVFKIHREFDAVKERLLFLRDHPDLHSLEPEVMELAAKMSHESSELARIYNDEAVARAKEMLEQRMQEAAEMEAQIEKAQSATRDLKQWIDRVEMDEDVAQSRLERLREDLDETLARVGLKITDLANNAPGEDDVIFLPAPGSPRPAVTMAAE